MHKYYPPNDFHQDKKSGLYYQFSRKKIEQVGKDPEVHDCVVWFNPQTGLYTQPQVYDHRKPLKFQDAYSPFREELAAIANQPEPPCQGTAWDCPNTIKPIALNSQNSTATDQKHPNKFYFIIALLLAIILIAGALPTVGIDIEFFQSIVEQVRHPNSEVEDVQPVPQSIFCGEELSALLGEDEPVILSTAGALWNIFDYQEGSLDRSYIAELELPSVAQATNGTLLKATIEETYTIYEGLLWASNDYDVANYLGQTYWFEFTVFSEEEASFTIHAYQAPSAQLSASNTLADSGKVSYIVYNISDNDPATAWVSDSGLSESIEFALAEQYEIYGYAILNGYWKTDDIFASNGIAASIDVWSEDNYVGGAAYTPPVYDSYIATNSGYSDICIFDEPVIGSSVGLLFNELTEDTTSDYLCISEIVWFAQKIEP